MIIVIDVNPLLSALIKDSTSRKIIADSPFDFCFPELQLHKVRKYKDLILTKSGLSETEFATLMNSLFRNIRMIPTEEILPYWEKAKEIMADIDLEDSICIATALSQEEAVVWSDDKHFDRQDVIKNLKTKELLELLD